MTNQVRNVLFLCSGNSARSILGEALLNRDRAGRFRAFSAGSQPKRVRHPAALAPLKTQGFDTSDLRSKRWEEFAGTDAPPMALVVTVCDHAAGETCSIWPGHPVTAHWGIPDPAAIEGPDQAEAFAKAMNYSQRRVPLLLARREDEMDALAWRDAVRAGGWTMVGAVQADRPALSRRLAAEALGSFFLFAAVIGSGIMGEALAGGNVAVALLANTAATGAILFVLITMLGPISGAHFNPAVTLVFASRHQLPWRDVAPYIAVQLIGGLLGAWAAHLMFGLPILQTSMKAREGIGQWTGEFIATFGLIMTILGTLKTRQTAVPAAVALYITSAYWFTSSTSFANPAITIVRSLSNSFAGIAPHNVPMFVVAQIAGSLAAALCCNRLFSQS